MKSRLIKFACHQCGTKLAVPPEMAGVTDQCPKCGTTITAPPESTLEPVRRKAKFAPVPKSETEAETPYSHQLPAQPELPVLPGWSASELADALKPPAPMPPYVPLAHSQAQLHSAEHNLLEDPPAIPDPGPAFMPKRKARGEEGAVAVAPPPPAPAPAPAPVRSDHPILGSILDAPTVPRSRATSPAPAPAWETPVTPELPAPAALPAPEALPSPEQVIEPAPSPAPAAPPLPPPPLAEITPQTAELVSEPVAPPSLELPGAPPALETPVQEQTHAEASSTEPSIVEAPQPLRKSLVAALTAEPLDAPSALAPTPDVPSAPIALVPETLPDARAAEEAHMPGMGEVLAGGQIAQDPAAPPDARDHRPLLHVPFLPVAESPAKGRRTQKRKLYIVGVVLFLLFDACLGIWLLNAPPGSLSETPPAQNPPAPTAPAPAQTGSNNTPTPTPAPSAPPITTPSELAAAPPESTQPSKPPMAIPLPGHSATDVPTATPIPVTEASTPADSKKAAEPGATPPPAAASTNPAPAPTPAPAPDKEAAKPAKPENAVAAGPDEPSWLLKAGSKSGQTAGPASPAPTASTPTAPAPTETQPAPAAPPPTAPTGADTSVAAMMGPQPTRSSAPSGDGDPPWLRRIQPTFPAIDGTPLLPATPDQPVGPPAPLPPPPGATDGSAVPSLAATTNMSVAPSTTPAPGANGESTTAPTPAPAAKPANVVGKVPDEAKSALDVLTGFLAAATWQERAAYVQKPEATKPAMEKHAAKFGDGPINTGMVKFVDRHPGRDGGPPYCMFEIEGGDLKHEVLVLIEQPAEGEPKIDWPTFVEFKDDLLLRFLETQGEPNQSFRVMLSRKHYFAKDVPDLASKDSFQVQQPNDRFDGHVFLPKSSALSKKLATQLNWNQNMPVIVELAWRTNGKLHWVEIVRIVSYGWRS